MDRDRELCTKAGGRRVTCSRARVLPDFDRRSSFVDAGWAEFWHRTGTTLRARFGNTGRLWALSVVATKRLRVVSKNTNELKTGAPGRR